MTSTLRAGAAGGDGRPRPRIVVCADDYAFTPGVSRAIRELLAAGRISATSVMAASEFWPAEAAALRQVASGADIGLHITLTDQTPLGPMPVFAPGGRFPAMRQVYGRAMTRRLPLAEIRQEIERQVAAFTNHFGAPPAYLDGHHHVQQLPGIRDVVIEIVARLGPGGAWVRCCSERPGLVIRRGVAPLKALAIGAFGHGLARRARRAGVATNHGFSGAYDYQSDQLAIGDLFERFVIGAEDNALLMCHPGYSDATLAARDVMTAARESELGYLMSEAWPALLDRLGLELGPLRRS